MEIVSELFNIMTKVFLLVLRKEWMLSLYIYAYIYIPYMEHIWVLFLYVNLLVGNVCVFAWFLMLEVLSTRGYP